MKRLTVITLVSIALIVAASLVLVPDDASAVPSFARQKGKACTDCHTIWPRLLAAGREFKELGYTDVGDTYPRIQEDNLDLLGLSGTPLSVSVISFPYLKTNGQQSEIRIPDEVALFFAGRITPNIGGFVEPKWARDTGQFSLELVKLAGATRVAGNNNLGIVFLKSDVAGADLDDGDPARLRRIPGDERDVREPRQDEEPERREQDAELERAADALREGHGIPRITARAASRST